jgi:hypothetical protein
MDQAGSLRKMNCFRRGILVLLFCLPVHRDAQLEAQTRSIAQTNYVPDQQTAIRIAEAVLIPIYGSQDVADERPFKARLEGNIWIIEGTTVKTPFGGVATVKLQRSDGRIISVIHGK